MRLKPKVTPLRIGAPSGPVLRACIYARKSNDDNYKTKENKSVTRQIDEARDLIARKGWLLDEKRHVYVDDGISGKFLDKRRPGYWKMMNELDQFNVIVLENIDRLGRPEKPFRMLVVQDQIEEAGVQLWDSTTEEQIRFDGDDAEIISYVKAHSASTQRKVAGQKALAALTRKAEAGFSTGGACYGYILVPRYKKNGNGEQVRSHTDFKKNKAEADVVVRIFQAYADGYSHAAIAKALNGTATAYGPKGKRRRMLTSDLDAIRKQYFDGQTPPAPKKCWAKRGLRKWWGPSTIRDILYRERYRGFIPYNGTLTPRPDLRIVDERLWQRVQQRLKDVRALYIRDGKAWWGRPSAERYLLSAMGKCTSCGKNLAVIGGSVGSPGRRKRVYYYGCSLNHRRGAACDNSHHARMEWLDSAVIEAIRAQLKPEHIAYTAEAMARKVEQELKQNRNKPRQLDAEARDLTAKIERFKLAIGDLAPGKEPKAIVAEIARLEARLEEIEQEQKRLAEATTVWTTAQIREKCGTQLRRFEELLLGEVPLARQALRRLLDEPLRISPATVQGKQTLRFEGQTNLGPLLDTAYKGWVSSTRTSCAWPATSRRTAARTW